MPFGREPYPFVPLLFLFVPQRARRYSPFQFLRNYHIGKLAILKDIVMRHTAFETELFVPLLFSFVPQRARRYNVFKNFGNAPRERLGRPIFESCEVKTKIKEAQTGTNDSLSNAVGLILISSKMINFPSCISEI